MNLAPRPFGRREAAILDALPGRMGLATQLWLETADVVCSNHAARDCPPLTGEKRGSGQPSEHSARVSFHPSFNAEHFLFGQACENFSFHFTISFRRQFPCFLVDAWPVRAPSCCEAHYRGQGRGPPRIEERRLRPSSFVVWNGTRPALAVIVDEEETRGGGHGVHGCESENGHNSASPAVELGCSAGEHLHLFKREVFENGILHSSSSLRIEISNCRCMQFDRH